MADTDIPRGETAAERAAQSLCLSFDEARRRICADAGTRLVVVGGTDQAALARLARCKEEALAASQPRPSSVVHVFPSRLEAEAAQGAGVHVSVGDLELHAIAAGQADIGNAGRRPHVLLRHEIDELFDDMQVIGLKPRRLKEMMKYFFNQMSRHDAGDTSWLEGAEEDQVFGRMRELLDERGAVLPCELGPLALASLRKGCVGERPAFVIAESFDVLGGQDQAFVREFATRQLLVCGQRAFAQGPSDRWQGPAGLPEPVQDAGTLFVELDAASWRESEGTAPLACAVAALADHREADVPLLVEGATLPVTGDAERTAGQTSALELAVFELPEDEWAAVAGCIADEVAQAGGGRGIVAVAPNAVEAKGLRDRLETLGVASELLGDRGCAPGAENRDQAQAAWARFWALLGLAADPDDLVSLRSWVGAGQWMHANDAWDALRTLACARKADISTVLSALASGELDASLLDNKQVAIKKLEGPLHKLELILPKIQGLTGTALLAGLEEETGWTAGAPMRALVDEGMGACQVDATLRAYQADPWPVHDEAVLVAVADPTSQVPARSLYLLGMVDGLVPGPKVFDDLQTIDGRNRLFKRDRAALARQIGSASQRATLALFTTEDFMRASRIGASIDRIFARDGRRLARMRPSVFLKEAGLA